jgi:hypothetical protein
MELEEETKIDVPDKPTHRKNLTLKLIVLILSLVLLISCGSIGYTTIYRPYALHVQSTNTAIARVAQTANSTAIAQATTMASIHATETVLAQRQIAFDKITNTTPTLNDTLSSPDTYNWDTGSGCSFTNNAYTTVVTQKGFFLPCLAKKTFFRNFVYQVHMKISKGDAGGLIIRADTNTTQSYLFVVGQDGTFSIYYYPGIPKQRARTLFEGYSDLIHTGSNQENILGVVASGTSLDFYINKTYITSIIDSNRTAGLIGVLANNYTATTKVIYTLAQLWDLH